MRIYDITLLLVDPLGVSHSIYVQDLVSPPDAIDVPRSPSVIDVHVHPVHAGESYTLLKRC
jgi:hypothetical protein